MADEHENGPTSELSVVSRRSLVKGGVALGLAGVHLPDAARANSKHGTVIVRASVWDGVTVFSNGNSFNNGVRGNFGLEFQCVELVQRFYARRGYPNNWHANAVDMYDRAGSSSEFTDFVKVENGGKRKPAWGDILIFNTAGRTWSVGHVAVIYAVTSDRVYFVEQNIGSQSNLTATGKGSLPLSYNSKSKKYTISVPSNSAVKYPSVRGWLHTVRPAVAWTSPVRNEGEYVPSDPWGRITLRVTPRGDKAIDSVAFWRQDENDADWVFIDEATRSPWSTSFDLAPVEWGW